MRPKLTLLSSVALAVALAPLASAQTSDPDDDGCIRTDPCPWIVFVDQDGFQAGTETQRTVTLGDWYELQVFSDDPDQSHTVSLSDHDVSVTVAPDEYPDDGTTFQFSKLGDFTLKDMPSGDTFPVHVIAGDSAEADGSTSAASKGGPALPWAILAVGLVAFTALVARRD